jgi:plasmid stability protein
MAQLLVRNIEKKVKLRLQRRAKRNGRSMEEEVRDILRDAVKGEEPTGGGLGTEIAELFSKAGFDEGIPELRGFKIKPPHFGQ